jgi:RHH-type proline utilization regulon transcriptional repressor/proline dehydrogenase/delta 1-pyrroline-5-carboxylate dehydrogenase
LPALIELDRARELKEEVFGPVLHVVRWNAEELDALLDDIATNRAAMPGCSRSTIRSRARSESAPNQQNRRAA